MSNAITLTAEEIKSQLALVCKRNAKTIDAVAALKDAGFKVTKRQVNKALGRAVKVYTPNLEFDSLTENKKALYYFACGLTGADILTTEEILSAIGWACTEKSAAARVLAAVQVKTEYIQRQVTAWQWPRSVDREVLEG